MRRKPKDERPLPPLEDGVYRVLSRTFCAGFVVEHGAVKRCAPILRRLLPHWSRLATRL